MLGIARFPMTFYAAILLAMATMANQMVTSEIRE